MMDIVARLGEARKEDATGWAVPDELALSTRAKATRREGARRAAVIGVTAAVITVSAVVVGVDSRHGTPQRLGVAGGNVASTQPGHVIPWVNLRPHYVDYRPKSRRHSASVGTSPACSASQLQVAPVGPATPAGSSQLVWILPLINVGSTTCSLAGPLTAVLQPTSAMPATNIASMSDDGLSLTTPAVLSPGQSAELPIRTFFRCTAPGSESDATSVSVSLSGVTESFPIPSGDTFSADCGIEVGAFGVPAAAPPAIKLDGLTASIELPSTVAAGHTTRYTITLSNPTSQPISLSPCPSYTEGLASPGGTAHMPLQVYELNCSAAPAAVPAGGALTFAMQGAGLVGSGVGQLVWHLEGTAVGTGATTIAS